MDARLLVGAEGSGAVRAEGERVALPVDEAVEQHGEAEREDDAGLTPDEPADGHEQAAEERHQGPGLERVAEVR